MCSPVLKRCGEILTCLHLAQRDGGSPRRPELRPPRPPRHGGLSNTTRPERSAGASGPVTSYRSWSRPSSTRCTRAWPWAWTGSAPTSASSSSELVQAAVLRKSAGQKTSMPRTPRSLIVYGAHVLQPPGPRCCASQWTRRGSIIGTSEGSSQAETCRVRTAHPLVAARDESVDLHGLDVHGPGADRLRAVDHEEDSRLPADPAQLHEIGRGTGEGVDPGESEHTRSRRERLPHAPRIDTPPGLAPDEAHADAVVPLRQPRQDGGGIVASTQSTSSPSRQLRPYAMRLRPCDVLSPSTISSGRPPTKAARRERSFSGRSVNAASAMVWGADFSRAASLAARTAAVGIGPWCAVFSHTCPAGSLKCALQSRSPLRTGACVGGSVMTRTFRSRRRTRRRNRRRGRRRARTAGRCAGRQHGRRGAAGASTSEHA